MTPRGRGIGRRPGSPGIVPSDASLTVTTSRLRLVPLTAADADELVVVLADADLYRYIGGAPPRLDELRSRLAAWEQRASPDRTQLWLNWTLRLVEGGVAVGYVQATVADAEAAVAYVVGREWWGRGLASEALVATCELLRARIGVERIVAHIDPGNVASERVAARAGLRATGRLDGDGEQVWRRP